MERQLEGFTNEKYLVVPYVFLITNVIIII
jgi:hypothetical protein